MNLSSSDIEQDIYDMLKGSGLEAAISGSIYKSGMRPFNSSSQDVVITFLSGLSNQIQRGIVNVNVYVPNTLIDDRYYKNTITCKLFETELKNWLETLESDKYLIKLDKTLQVFAEPKINQHFINARLNFKLLIQ